MMQSLPSESTQRPEAAAGDLAITEAQIMRAVAAVKTFGLSAGLTLAVLCLARWLAPGYQWPVALIWAGKLALSAGLVYLGAWDMTTGRLPNLGVMSVLGLASASFAFRLCLGQLPSNAIWVALIGWLFCLVYGGFEVFSGGDVKLMMAGLACFPDLRFVWLLLVAIFGGSVFIIVRRKGWAGLRAIWAIIFTSFTSMRLPTREDVRASRSAPGGEYQYGGLISVAMVVALWLL